MDEYRGITLVDEKERTAVTVIVILWIAPAMLLRGWVATKLWTWFAVPALGLPSLGVGFAVGISILITLWFHDTNSNAEVSWKWLGRFMSQSIFVPLWLWLIGLITHGLIA